MNEQPGTIEHRVTHEHNGARLAPAIPRVSPGDVVWTLPVDWWKSDPLLLEVDYRPVQVVVVSTSSPDWVTVALPVKDAAVFEMSASNLFATEDRAASELAIRRGDHRAAHGAIVDQIMHREPRNPIRSNGDMLTAPLPEPPPNVRNPFRNWEG